jgi:hypothetical protein
MSRPENLPQFVACQQTVLRLYHTLDHSDYTAASTCFTPDGCWERGGVPLNGQQQILESLRKRPATLFTRHYVSNFLVLEHRGTTAKAAFSLTVYRLDKGEPATLPVAGTMPAMLADVICELTCNDSGDWLIQQLGVQITFVKDE